MVFLHRGQAFSTAKKRFSLGLNGNYGGKTEIISDCQVKSSLKNHACESHKAQTIWDVQTQKHCIKSLGVSDQRSKYSNTLGKFQLILTIIFFGIDYR